MIYCFHPNKIKSHGESDLNLVSSWFYKIMLAIKILFVHAISLCFCLKDVFYTSGHFFCKYITMFIGFLTFADATKVKKDGDASGVGDDEKKESLPLESKSAKKKKKKDKSSREVREQEDQPNSSDVTNGLGENVGAENAEEDASVMDVKERLKKMASVKKKKSNKELDSASKAAAIEAAARSAKLAAAKKKEKNHYNQQPVR